MVVIGAGFIAGESLMGVLWRYSLSLTRSFSWFVISMFGGLVSIAFFAWFTAVFIMLSASTT